MKTYPGTVIEATTDGKTFLDGLMVAGGIMMGQLVRLTGVGTPTLQNWIGRGWISRPVGKRYTKNQVARLLIVNSLRSTMKLEEIDSLLYYVNGEFQDESDDIIDEAELYYLVSELALSDDISAKNIHNRVIALLNGYEEKVSGAKKRLETALTAIAESYAANSIIEERNVLLKSIKEAVRGASDAKKQSGQSKRDD